MYVYVYIEKHTKCPDDSQLLREKQIISIFEAQCEMSLEEA